MWYNSLIELSNNNYKNRLKVGKALKTPGKKLATVLFSLTTLGALALTSTQVDAIGTNDVELTSSKTSHIHRSFSDNTLETIKTTDDLTAEGVNHGKIGRSEFYTVAKGDTIVSISKRSGVPVSKLTALNGSDIQLSLLQGRKLRLVDAKEWKQHLATEKAKADAIAKKKAQAEAEKRAREQANKQASVQSTSSQANYKPVNHSGIEWDANGLLVEEPTARAQYVINLELAIPGHANGSAFHKSSGLDSAIDGLTTAEAIYVIHRIEGAGFGQTSAGYAGIDSNLTHSKFVEQQLNRRFGGSVHNLLKAWGTYSYTGY